MEGFILHEKRLAEGICANGCAPMRVISRWDAECPACGFHWSCNTPHNLPGSPAGVRGIAFQDSGDD